MACYVWVKTRKTPEFGEKAKKYDLPYQRFDGWWEFMDENPSNYPGMMADFRLSLTEITGLPWRDQFRSGNDEERRALIQKVLDLSPERMRSHIMSAYIRRGPFWNEYYPALIVEYLEAKQEYLAVLNQAGIKEIKFIV